MIRLPFAVRSTWATPDGTRHRRRWYGAVASHFVQTSLLTPVVAALVTTKRDFVLFRGDYVTPRFLTLGAHEAPSRLTGSMTVRELKVSIRERQRLAITDRSNVHNQHRLGVMLARAPVDPLADANQPIASRSNRVVRDTTQHHQWLPFVTSSGASRNPGKRQVGGDSRDIQPAARQIEHFFVRHVEGQHHQGSLVQLGEGGSVVSIGGCP